MQLPVVTCDSVATESCHLPDVICDHVATSACPFDRRSLIAELTSRGVRLTSQRRAVIETIQEAKEHLDAAALLSRAREKEPGLDRATVYRTLDLLKKHRLIDELDLMRINGEKHYFEVKTRRDHVHLACFECGKIEEFSSALFERLQSEIRQQAGFEIRDTRLQVGGRCKACREGAAMSSK